MWMPEVGGECEFNHGGNQEFQKCLIAGVHPKTGRPIVDHLRVDKALSHAPECWNFRPIQSEEDKIFGKRIGARKMKTQYRCNAITAEGKAICLPINTESYLDAHHQFMDYISAVTHKDAVKTLSGVNIEAVEMDNSSDQSKVG